MSIRKIPFLLLVIACFSFWASTKNSPGAIAPMRAWASDSPSPGDLQKIQSEFAGTWAIQEKGEPTEKDRKGATGEGTEVWRTEKGGMPFVEEYHCKFPAEEAHDTAYFWWDSNTKQTRGLWCADFNGEGCSNFFVRRDGESWVLDGEFVNRGERLAWHEVFSKKGADAFLQTLDMGKPDSTLKHESTIHGTRIKK